MVVRHLVLVSDTGEVHLQVPQEWKGREVEVRLMPIASDERELDRVRFDAFVQEHGSAVGSWSLSREEANDRGLS